MEINAFNPAIVVHYHELWLKGCNRRFFLRKLSTALRHSLQGIPVERIEQLRDRFVVRLKTGASAADAVARVERVLGVAYYALARPAQRSMESICAEAWREIEPLQFATFAVRARRSDKSFAQNSMEIESLVGRHLLENFQAAGRGVRVQLKNPDVTCHIEITSGPALIYARKISGPGGLPANTAGRMTCLLSGGYDSAVAAYHMMKRGAHLSFVHFYGTGAKPGESSLHVAGALVRQLVHFQFQAKLHRVPLDAIQREIVRYAPEKYRILLYRRMMLRIAEVFARRDRSLGLVTGDSLGQVASQTLRNMVAVEAAAKMPVFRPLVGADKMEILATARKIGTYEISSEPFHDCCPVFMPRTPALSARPEELDEAESNLDIPALVDLGVRSTTHEMYRYVGGRVQVEERIPRASSASRAAAAAGEGASAARIPHRPE